MFRTIPSKDFEHILCYAQVMFGPCVRGDSQFKTLKDLVQYAKANPGKIKYSAAGLAVSNHFGMVQIAKTEGIKWELVVFKGNIEAVSACLGGHVDIVSQNPADVVPYIKAGRLKTAGLPMQYPMEVGPEGSNGKRIRIRFRRRILLCPRGPQRYSQAHHGQTPG